MTWIDYLRTALALLILVGLLAGLCYIGHLISNPYPRGVHVRVSARYLRELQERAGDTVRANPPQPEPVDDTWSLHDHVLKYFLSPELRGEFANSPNFHPVALKREPDITLNTEAPSGASTVDGASRPRPVSG